MRKRPFTTCYVFVCALKYAFVFSHEMLFNMLIYYVLCVFCALKFVYIGICPLNFCQYVMCLSICHVFVNMLCVFMCLKISIHRYLPVKSLFEWLSPMPLVDDGTRSSCRHRPKAGRSEWLYFHPIW